MEYKERALSSRNVSGHTGVSWDDTKRMWRATVFYKGKLYNLWQDPFKTNCIYIRNKAVKAINDDNFEQFLKKLRFQKRS